MTALKTRTRAVIFRLTEEEYNLLREACRDAGARNLSDFTRTGILTHLETDRFSVIEERLKGLQQDLKQLRETLIGPA